MKSVLIIGGGAAGLQSANILVRAGVSVTLLEAQNRLGGRIHSLCTPESPAPVELGAEFIHGMPPELWELVRSANLSTHEAPQRQWRPDGGKLVEDDKLFEEFEKLIEEAGHSPPDISFSQFLEKHRELDPKVKEFALNYVEGFNAADARDISLKTVVAYESDSDPSSHRTFRINAGYSKLIEFLEREGNSKGAKILLNHTVRVLRWSRGRVEALAQTPSGEQTFSAEASVVTVPIGVWQQSGPYGITFVPDLPQKKDAAARMRMGQVVKVTLEFNSRFWPVENFGFIHATQEALPTWWSDERSCRLVGWAGGPKAKAFKGDAAMIYDAAFGSLSRIFHVPEEKLRKECLGVFTHRWENNPSAFGAYSYVPVGGFGAPALLAAPVQGTLFFAGEALVAEGQQGTVDSALVSARRAARECLRSME